VVFAVRVDASDDNANDDDANDDSDGDADDDGATGVDAFDVSSAITDSKSDCDYSLPRHQRCACHTLNLISMTDADNAERDAQYKKLSRSTFGKCNALWNKYGRSAQAVETVTGTYGLGLKRPNITRWNSVYMATDRLLCLINEKGEDEFRQVCAKLDVPRFKDAEMGFLSEYVSIMKPVAQSLNILQCETKMYLAYLLPTITVLKEKLQHKQSSAVTCKPLIAALLNGIDERFADMFTDRDCVAAAILHPKFRNTWTDDNTLIESGMQHIRYLLTTSSIAPTSSAANDGSSSTSTATDDDDFFSRRRAPQHQQDVLTQYMQTQTEDITTLTVWPELKELFIRLNTPLPASAASERLFSCAGLTMNSQRTRMSDKLFEDLVMLKTNNCV